MRAVAAARLCPPAGQLRSIGREAAGQARASRPPCPSLECAAGRRQRLRHRLHDRRAPGRSSRSARPMAASGGCASPGGQVSAADGAEPAQSPRRGFNAHRGGDRRRPLPASARGRCDDGAADPDRRRDARRRGGGDRGGHAGRDLDGARRGRRRPRRSGASPGRCRRWSSAGPAIMAATAMSIARRAGGAGRGGAGGRARPSRGAPAARAARAALGRTGRGAGRGRAGAAADRRPVRHRPRAGRSTQRCREPSWPARRTRRAVRVAIDLPSGVATDDGAILSPVPDFDLTITFQTLKPSHLLQPAARHMGRLAIADIGIAAASRAGRDRPAAAARRRDPTTHKYSRGLVADRRRRDARRQRAGGAAPRRGPGAGYVRLPARTPVAGVPPRSSRRPATRWPGSTTSGSVRSLSVPGSACRTTRRRGCWTPSWPAPLRWCSTPTRCSLLARAGALKAARQTRS